MPAWPLIVTVTLAVGSVVQRDGVARRFAFPHRQRCTADHQGRRVVVGDAQRDVVSWFQALTRVSGMVPNPSCTLSLSSSMLSWVAVKVKDFSISPSLKVTLERHAGVVGGGGPVLACGLDGDDQRSLRVRVERDRDGLGRALGDRVGARPKLDLHLRVVVVSEGDAWPTRWRRPAGCGSPRQSSG